MDGGAGRDEDGSADGLEEEEMGTLLNLKGEQGIDDETLARIIDLKMEKLTDCVNSVSKNATAVNGDGSVNSGYR